MCSAAQRLMAVLRDVHGTYCSIPILITALCVDVGDAVSTVSLFKSGWLPVFGWSQVILTICTALTTLALAWLPVHGAILMGGIWFVTAFLPPLAFTVSPFLVVNVAFTLAVLATRHAIMAMVLLTVDAAALTGIYTLCGDLHLDVDFGWSMILCFYAIVMILLAVMAIAQYRVQAEKLRSQKREQRNRMHLVEELHDDISNRLSNVSLWLEHRAASETDEPYRNDLFRIRHDVDEILSRTRTIVSLLRRDADVDQGITIHPQHESWLPAVQQILAREQNRLEQLGLSGTMLVADTTALILSREQTDLLMSFLHELCTDIGRYADMTGGYVLSVQERDSAVVISVCDTPRHTDGSRPASNSTGWGLMHYADEISRLGGTMSVEQPDGQWSLVAHIPVSQTDV